MNRDEFLKEVQSRGGFDSKEHAQEATTAVLTILGQRMKGGETKDLASQLPQGVKEVLPPIGGGEMFPIEEFDRRVADLEGAGCSPNVAHDHAKAVITTVLDSVSPGEADDVRAQLPDAYFDFVEGT